MNIIISIKQVCDFIKLNKGYYIFSKKFKNKNEAEDALREFYKTYPYYKSTVKIIVLPCNQQNQEKTYYKLFFIYNDNYINIFNIIVSKIKLLKNELTNDMYYISKTLDLDYLPFSFIKLLIDENTISIANNIELVYNTNKSLQIIMYNNNE